MEAAIPISAQQLDAELNLSARGEADGARNLPDTDDAQLSAAEAAIVARIEGAIAQQSSTLLGVGSTQDFATLPQELETLAAEPQTALAQFRARKARAQSAVQIELDAAQTDFERANRDYRAFRIQHGLTETEPNYDDVFWRKVFWLALLFTIEVAANGWVIGQASAGGLVQGWTTALMISVLVVLTGTVIGAGPWRYLNYGRTDGRGRIHRLWAIPAVVVGSAALVLFALYVAHYRYALSHAALDAPAPDNILSSILANPIQPFEQLESLMLFVIALLIGVFAVARGVHWDDPYPGYGQRHRRVEAARERARELMLSLSGQVDAAKEGADETLNGVAARSQEAVGALKQALARTQDNAGAWDQSSAELLAAGREAIAIYRAANRAARTTREPAYFSADAFAATSAPASIAIVDALDNALARATANITQCKSQLAGARAQLEAEYQSFYDDEMAPFLKGVADAASVRVRGEFLEPGAVIEPAPRAELTDVLPLRRSSAR